MITQRAAIIGVVGGCFYLITIVNSLPPYFYVLAWLSASALVSCFGLALLSLQGLNCHWRVERKSAAEDLSGQSGPVLQIELGNGGTLNKTGLVLEARLCDPGNRLHVRRFLVEALPARARLSTELVLTELPRGRYDVMEVRIVGSDVLGLFRAFKRIRIPRDMAEDKSVTARSEVMATLRRLRSRFIEWRAAREWGRREHEEEPRLAQLLVGPATVNPGRSATGVSREAAGGESAASDLTGRGDELRGTRPYVAGDDLRSVHWRSTARLGQLVVREFDRTTRAESVVVWDGSEAFQSPERRVPGIATKRRVRRRKRRGAVRQNLAVEQGLRMTASLCRALLESGKPCALLRLDSDPVFIASPKRGAAAMRGQFGDALAVADASRASGLAEALAIFLRHVPPGAEVFLVTAQSGEALRRAVHALQRLGTGVTVVRVETAATPEAANDLRVVTLDGTQAPADVLAPIRTALLEAFDARPPAARGISRNGIPAATSPATVGAA